MKLMCPNCEKGYKLTSKKEKKTGRILTRCGYCYYEDLQEKFIVKEKPDVS